MVEIWWSPVITLANQIASYVKWNHSVHSPQLDTVVKVNNITLPTYCPVVLKATRQVKYLRLYVVLAFEVQDGPRTKLAEGVQREQLAGPIAVITLISNNVKSNASIHQQRFFPFLSQSYSSVSRRGPTSYVEDENSEVDERSKTEWLGNGLLEDADAWRIPRRS